MGMGRGEDRARMIARMKQDTLRLLQTQNYIDHPELGRVAIIHYESDMMAGYRPGTPRDFRYSELRLVDGAGKQLEDQKAVLNLPMRGNPVRPNIINAVEISPYSLVETKHNCAVYALAKHCEIPIETVLAKMKVLFAELHPEETKFFVSPAMVLRWCEKERSCYFFIHNQLHTKNIVESKNKAIAFHWHSNHFYLLSLIHI